MMLLLRLGVLLALLAGVAAQCANENCESGGCKSSQFEKQGNSTCPDGSGGTLCCDRQCQLGSQTQSCGTNNRCVTVRRRAVTTPSSQRAPGCEDEVTVTGDACQDNSCRDCEVRSWSDWSSCDRSCGNGGKQTRNRGVRVSKEGAGADCPNRQERRDCQPKPPPCPINCEVTGWSEWSGCSGTCSPAFKRRVRAVVTMDQFGGTKCPILDVTTGCLGLPDCAPVLAPTPAPTFSFDIPTRPPTPTMTAANPSNTRNSAAGTAGTSATNQGGPPMMFNVPGFGGGLVDGSTSNLRLGQSVWIYSVNGDNLQAPTVLTEAEGVLGVGAPNDNSSAPGVIVAPYGLQLQFDQRRAITKLVLSGYDAGDKVSLVGFDNSRRRQARIDIEVTAAESDLTEYTARGFDNYDLRALEGSFGLASFETMLGDPTAPLPMDPNDGAGADSGGGGNVMMPVRTVRAPDADGGGGGLTTLHFVLIAVGACLCVSCIIVLIVVVRMSGDDDDDDDDRYKPTARPSAALEAMLQDTSTIAPPPTNQPYDANYDDVAQFNDPGAQAAYNAMPTLDANAVNNQYGGAAQAMEGRNNYQTMVGVGDDSAQGIPLGREEHGQSAMYGTADLSQFQDQQQVEGNVGDQYQSYDTQNVPIQYSAL